MCGIIGYIGQKDALPVLLQGLERMEYRGYDSAGVAIIDNGVMHTDKTVGRINMLLESTAKRTLPGKLGLGHTRWATHGVPSVLNAHPHFDQNKTIALVHNGIIENYQSIRLRLEREGIQFVSETDTEVLAQLIGFLYNGNLEQAVQEALSQVEGAYGIAVIHKDEPDTLIAARVSSPIIIGLGVGENFVASDPAALVNYTRNVSFLDDGEVAVVTRDKVEFKKKRVTVTKAVERISYDIDQIERGGFPHFMLKEIYHQPQTLSDTMRGRILKDEGDIKLGGLSAVIDDLAKMKRIIFLGCGTAWHAGLIGECLFEDLAKIPVEVEYASEFRYRDPVIEPGTIAIAISQSGETADTLAAVREAKQKGAMPIGIVNVVGSTIARETAYGSYLHAGPEIGVASTKAFTSQVLVLTMLAIKLGRLRGVLSQERAYELVNELVEIPKKVAAILELRHQIRDIALRFSHSKNFLYLGRGYQFPVALEGALKLKEISYIHAEGYPAAEMKHGPIALIDENMPVVFLAPRDPLRSKLISNIEQVRARGGIVISICNEGDDEIRSRSNEVIEIPYTLPQLSPILSVIPLQILAYDVAVNLGLNVDRPRNLAKSVT
ncbi:MAG: glutamine--fructose-6-phosphate transaminase (isomerizing), partial [bacterium]|nr:glutamine--fructose-6-phosphate transaminase (isomerizing) [bacterium]